MNFPVLHRFKLNVIQVCFFFSTSFFILYVSFNSLTDSGLRSLSINSYFQFIHFNYRSSQSEKFATTKKNVLNFFSAHALKIGISRVFFFSFFRSSLCVRENENCCEFTTQLNFSVIEYGAHAIQITTETVAYDRNESSQSLCCSAFVRPTNVCWSMCVWGFVCLCVEGVKTTTKNA